MNSPDWEGDTAGRRSLLPTLTLGIPPVRSSRRVIWHRTDLDLQSKHIDGALVDAFYFLYAPTRLALDSDSVTRPVIDA